jgi:acetolactate synthase-1/2/3 large subunit
VARLGLPITFVQLSNGSYGWIKMLQHLYHDRRYFGVDIGFIDAAAIARGFGLTASRVDSRCALERALRDSANASGPAFVDVIIPDMTSLEPPVASWSEALNGGETIRPVY